MEREKQLRKSKKERQKQTSIRGKLLKNTLSILIIYLVALGCISSYLNYSSTVESLEQTMVR